MSAPALAANEIENSDDQSSVTFLSFACSGAETRHLIRDLYKGMEPPGPNAKGVRPQLEAVKAAVKNRTINVLLVTIGINDLNFSGVVTACGHPVDGAIEKIWASAGGLL